MTDMAVALERAGAKEKLAFLTLRSFMYQALHQTGKDAVRAGRQLEAELTKNETWLAELCQHYAQSCLNDMGRLGHPDNSGGVTFPVAPRERKRVPASVKHRSAIKKIGAAVTRSLFDTAKTGDNRLWAETEAGDLLRFDKDGQLARMLWDKYVRARADANPDVLRWPLKEVITADEFEECWRACQRNNIPQIVG